MNLTDCNAAARTLMDEHGLKTWGLEWDNGKRRMGACHQYPGRGVYKITLSRHYARLNTWGVMRAVVLHEVAHALVGPRQGHGRMWQAKAIELGVKPTPCAGASEVTSPPAKYSGVCSSCEKIVATAHRMGAQMRRRNQYHTTCGSSSRIDWREN